MTTLNSSHEAVDNSTHTAPIDHNGTVRVAAFDLPLSIYMSPQAQRAFIAQDFNSPALRAAMMSMDLMTMRTGMDNYLFGPMFERAKAHYAVHINETRMHNVSVAVVTPTDGIAEINRDRVLINLHGGFFTVGAGLGGLVESLPMAALGRIKVVSIDYRQGPEHQFPAASEDVAAVYRYLLQDCAPENIGIYGASAGGLLTAMALAWFQKEDLPRPGAVALLAAGAVASMGGDSGFTAPALMGQTPPPAQPNPPFLPIPYLFNTDPQDPLVAPTAALAVLAKFPPTLLLTGTRSFDLGAAVYTQRRLMQAGATVDLQLWDGMWHCFFYDASLPESAEAFVLLTKFFDRHLGYSAP